MNEAQIKDRPRTKGVYQKMPQARLCFKFASVWVFGGQSFSESFAAVVVGTTPNMVTQVAGLVSLKPGLFRFWCVCVCVTPCAEGFYFFSLLSHHTAGGHSSIHQSVANEATDVWRGYKPRTPGSRTCNRFELLPTLFQSLLFASMVVP